jgi:hypothetical protein
MIVTFFVSRARVLLLVGTLFIAGCAAASEPKGITPEPRNPVIRDHSDGFDATELSSKSLKVALIGDSLSVPFHYTSLFKTSSMIHDNRKGSWFYDADPKNSLRSLFEKLSVDDHYPTEVMSLAIAGSWIREPDFFNSARLFGMDSMDRQVSRILSEPAFPNLILVWQGHNDADWRYAANGEKIPDSGLADFRERLPERVTQNLRVQLQRLVDRARSVSYPVTIVVFGLLDARSALDTRELVLREKQKNPALYPYLADAIKGFPSLTPDYRSETTAVFDAVLASWRKLTSALNTDPRVQVLYSDALTAVKFTPALVSKDDGLHLRVPEGHQAFADAAYNELHRRGILEFLHSAR